VESIVASIGHFLAATDPIVSEDPFTHWIAVAAGVVAVVGGLYSIYRVVRRVEEAIGVDEHGRTLVDRMERVEHQLWPNGGGSLADKVSRVEKETNAIRSEHEVIRDLLKTIVENTTKKPRRRNAAEE
jgi:NADH:ubiquinone oxidoreductase subunit B-like Fe-S oxidoreductase